MEMIHSINCRSKLQIEELSFGTWMLGECQTTDSMTQTWQHEIIGLSVTSANNQENTHKLFSFGMTNVEGIDPVMLVLDKNLPIGVMRLEPHDTGLPLHVL